MVAVNRVASDAERAMMAAEAAELKGVGRTVGQLFVKEVALRSEL